jgi:hypothetical protein
VLAPLWDALDGDAVAFARALDGVFAFVLVDAARGVVVVGRDPFGVRPLFEATARAGTAAPPLVDAAVAAAVSCAFPGATRDALGARVDAWAGAAPGVCALPRVGVTAAPAAAPPRAARRVWASELRGALPAVEGGAFDVAQFPPGRVRSYALASGALQRDEAFFATPWVKHPAYGFDAEGAAQGGVAAPPALILSSGRPSPWPHALARGAAAARAAVHDALVAAVEKRMLSDVRVGALLSGGLDSSLVAALAARALAARGGGRLATFSIGMRGSADCAAARLVAAHIGSEHHEIIVSEDNFWAALPEVVVATETFDITSVRASVGNYLLAKYVRERTDVRVLLNGDGADEISGSYLYFHAAPSDGAFEAEVQRLVRDIHAFDVLRSDRCVAAWGLEARTPFLDKQFVAVYLSVGTALRRPRRGGAVEKQLLREAFDERVAGGAPLLPASVLWRRKEAFSDGVSAPERSWFEAIADRMRGVFPGEGDGADAPWARAAAVFPAGPTKPFTRESLAYRALFEAAFGPDAASVIPYFWLPRWSGGATDPSARTLAVYADDSAAV